MRLTRRNGYGRAMIGGDMSPTERAMMRPEILDRLAAYEDTGFEPEEIRLNLDGLDEYRKAEAEGRLVVLPCKVGDTVFLVEGHSVYQSQVESITLRDDGLWLDGTFNHFGLVYFSGEIGRNVFLSREEAEAALKGERKDV